MNRLPIVIFTAVVLDAVGLGLIFPILPSLPKDVTCAENVAPCIGIVMALYPLRHASTDQRPPPRAVR